MNQVLHDLENEPHDWFTFWRVVARGAHAGRPGIRINRLELVCLQLEVDGLGFGISEYLQDAS